MKKTSLTCVLMILFGACFLEAAGSNQDATDFLEQHQSEFSELARGHLGACRARLPGTEEHGAFRVHPRSSGVSSGNGSRRYSHRLCRQLRSRETGHWISSRV